MTQIIYQAALHKYTHTQNHMLAKHWFNYLIMREFGIKRMYTLTSEKAHSVSMHSISMLSISTVLVIRAVICNANYS